MLLPIQDGSARHPRWTARCLIHLACIFASGLLSAQAPLVVPVEGIRASGHLASTASPIPIPLGGEWRFYGDSQTEGVELERSHAAGFRDIWFKSFPLPHPQVLISGYGGCNLEQSLLRYQSHGSNDRITFIHIQESGSQDHDCQRTPGTFGETFVRFMRAIHGDAPGAVISYETAYSFQRESVPFRDWRPYNDMLRLKIRDLEAEGISVHLTDTHAKISELVRRLGFSNVIRPDGGHFNATGNLLVALSIYHTLGYDVNQLDLDHIPESTVSLANKTLCRTLAQSEPNLTLTSPNGGESWPLGEAKVIRWTGTSPTGWVRIELVQNGLVRGLIAKDVLADQGQHPWTVGELLGGGLASGIGFRVRIVAQ